jgi:hypothetical protein
MCQLRELGAKRSLKQAAYQSGIFSYKSAAVNYLFGVPSASQKAKIVLWEGRL